MKALVANDREAFYASEIEARERTGYPPFGRLASLIISAGDRPTAEGFARKLAAVAPLDERIQVLGPAEAPLAVIKGRYRFRLLVKSLRNVDLSEYLREWLAAGPRPKAISSSRSTSIRRAFCDLPLSFRDGAISTRSGNLEIAGSRCASPRNDDGNKKGLPSLATAGLVRTQKVLRPLRNATLTETLESENGA